MSYEQIGFILTYFPVFLGVLAATLYIAMVVLFNDLSPLSLFSHIVVATIIGFSVCVIESKHLVLFSFVFRYIL